MTILNFLLALLCASGCFRLMFFFYRRREDSLMRAFGLFFLVLGMALGLLSFSDFLTLLGNPGLSRSPVRSLIFRGFTAAAIAQLNYYVFKPIRKRR